jgi:hypothetical protein
MKDTRVRGQVLVLEPLVKIVDEIVEVFSTKVGVTSGILGLKKTLLGSQEGDIEKRKKNST